MVYRKKKIIVCLNSVTVNNNLNKDIINLFTEVKCIREHIFKTYFFSKKLLNIKEYASQKDTFKNSSIKKKQISCQNFYCHSLESRMLFELFKLLNKKALEQNNKILSFIPFFDGAYIKFENPNILTNLPNFLSEITYVNFKQKEIKPHWLLLDE